MLQLGSKAGTEQCSPVELLEYAILAEQAGFDSISASDHFHPWSVLPRLRETSETEVAAASAAKPARPDHDFIDEHNP
jgi:alkanesulfonate monooxygenase SsuD/methylene tetrahydromethanopterin reductase-like flavin-dependent oxidoreductase (luciferase family)